MCPEAVTAFPDTVLSRIVALFDLENTPPPCEVLVPNLGLEVAVAVSSEIVEFRMVALVVAARTATPPP